MLNNIPREIILLKFFQSTWGLDGIDKNIFSVFETMLKNDKMTAFIDSSNTKYIQLNHEYNLFKQKLDSVGSTNIEDRIKLDEMRIELEYYNDWHNKFLKKREEFINLISNIQQDEIEMFNSGKPLQAVVNNTLFIASKGLILEVNCGLKISQPKYIESYNKEELDHIFNNLNTNEKI